MSPVYPHVSQREASENATIYASRILVPIHRPCSEPVACRRPTNSLLGDTRSHLADEIPHSVVWFAEMAACNVAQVECGLRENGHF